MDQKGIVSIEVKVNDQLFSFNMPMNGKATYGHALEAALKIVADLEAYIKEMEAKSPHLAKENSHMTEETKSIEPEVVPKEV